MTYYQSLAQELVHALTEGEVENDILSENKIYVFSDYVGIHNVEKIYEDVFDNLIEATKSLVIDESRIKVLKDFVNLFSTNNTAWNLCFRDVETIIKTADILNRIVIAIQEYEKENV